MICEEKFEMRVFSLEMTDLSFYEKRQLLGTINHFDILRKYHFMQSAVFHSTKR